MSVLSYQTIKNMCIEFNLVSPWSERAIFNGLSYGIGPASYDFRVDQDITIVSQGFILCSTIESVHIPDHICARVCDKSTWARKGLVVQNTHFDPGFIGVPTIELSNHSDSDITINMGTPICQFIFETLDFPTMKPYTGKYQNQKAEPVEAKYEKIEESN